MSATTRKTAMPGQRIQMNGTTADGRQRGARTSSSNPSDAVSAERIRTRAHEIYQARNSNGWPGDATSDWLEAEQELNESAPDPGMIKPLITFS